MTTWELRKGNRVLHTMDSDGKEHLVKPPVDNADEVAAATVHPAEAPETEA